ncbi:MULTISPECIES: SipW-dependent-type signal peptide-containing protein [Halolamina]|uniref:SipW-cognate class signal peptide n=1 Tax=Halolamina pelagica TaxID=699431 RepID=A0A1I5WJJ0_9EURY|nr:MULTISPECIES: SipW-dependent-type signal peptide-containing protein [Halolamina]NHX37546.1 hypothetical protein [Halolamina sp. R1-12]SFQ19943.1 SipW-cognate class signal peptide [Halolamina pelagica]
MSKQDITATRRNVLLGLGTVGLASAGAGLGTTAYFHDTESFEGNSLQAGEFDLRVRFHGQYNEPGEPLFGQSNGIIDGVNSMAGGQSVSESSFGYVVDDLKPGDWGFGEFCFQIIDNPGFVTLSGEVTQDSENGYTEPEPTTAADGDSNTPGDAAGEGELLDALLVDVSYSDGTFTNTGGNNASQYAPGTAKGDVFSGTLREFFANEYLFDADPTTVAADPVPGTDNLGEFFNPCLLFEFHVPTSVGNEIQSDILGFSLNFHAVQARHNAVVATDVGSGFVDVSPSVNANGGYGTGGESFASKMITGRARYGDSGGAAEKELTTGMASPTGDGKNIDWAPFFGQSTPFTFSYDANAATGTFALANDAVTSTVSGVSAPAGRIGLQAKANEATVSVANVAVTTDGSATTLVGPASFAASNDDGDGSTRDIQYLVIESDAAALTNGFTLSGDVTISPNGDFTSVAGANEDIALDVIVE